MTHIPQARANTRWLIASIFAVAAQLLLVMATACSWLPSVYTKEVEDIFIRGRGAFQRNYDLFLFRALIFLVIVLTLTVAFTFKKWIFQKELYRPVQRFACMTLGWGALGYWAAFEVLLNPAIGGYKEVFSIAIIGNCLIWGCWVVNPRWWEPMNSICSMTLVHIKHNIWVERIINQGTRNALIERLTAGICIIFLVLTHQRWLGVESLPYFWPLRFGNVGLYTLSFLVPIFYLMAALIAQERQLHQDSPYARWCRSLSVAGLVFFLIYVRFPISSNFWLTLYPLAVLLSLVCWKTAMMGSLNGVTVIWKSTTARVWVALLGGIECGLICTWIQEQVKLPIYPADFSIIVYFAFAAGGLGLYGLLLMGRNRRWQWQERLGSFAITQLALVTLASLAWFKLVVYDYRGDLARFWFHWLGILILLQPLVWPYLRSFSFWGQSQWKSINPRFRSWFGWVVILGLVFGASFVPNIEAMTAHIFLGEDMHHTDTFVMGTAWAVSQGAMINVDVYSRYGIGSVHFLLGLMKLLGGISYLNLFTSIVWICTIYFVLVYVFYRRWLGNTALALACWMMAFKAQIAFELAYPFVFTYPQSTVVRQWPDIIWMILMLEFMQSGKVWTLGLASLCVGFAMWYMPSIGCYMLVVHALLTVMVAWRNSKGRDRMMGSLWPTGLGLVTALLLFVAICGLWVFKPLYWSNAAGFVKYFMLANTVPLSELVTHKQFLNLAVFCIIVFVYLFTIIKVGLDYLDPRAQVSKKDWLALGLSFYGLGLLEHFVVFSMGNNFYSKTVPFYLIVFHWISKGLATLSGLWQKRLSWGLAGIAFVALVTHHGYMSYPNALNISSDPLLDKRVARPLPDGRPYFYHKHRYTITPAMLLPYNNLGNAENRLVTENDFKNYQEMIAYYHQASDFTEDARFISSLTAPQDRVLLLSSFEVRLLMQAKRRPFSYFFPILDNRPLWDRSLPTDMLYMKSDLKRMITDLDKDKPKIIFMEKVMARDDIPPAYDDSDPGLMALLRYVKVNYTPFKEGHYLMAYKRKE